MKDMNLLKDEGAGQYIIGSIYKTSNGEEQFPTDRHWLDKFNPHDGQLLCKVADSSANDVSLAVEAAEHAFAAWSEVSPVKRGQILTDIVAVMNEIDTATAECMRLLRNGELKKAEENATTEPTRLAS